jgi:hypothetical protein
MIVDGGKGNWAAVEVLKEFDLSDGSGVRAGKQQEDLPA